MKFLKILLTIPYALFVAWVLQQMFFLLIPIAMNISWGWFIVYLLFAGGFVSLAIGGLVTLLAMPNAWLTDQNNVAKIIATIIFAISALSPTIAPWGNGVANFSALQWIVAISLSIIILITYCALIGAMYVQQKEQPSQYSRQMSNVFENSTFSRLFNLLSQKDLTELAKDQQKDLTEILVKTPKEWKEYCLSRSKELNLEYKIGSTFYAKNEDSDSLVFGTITGIIFDVAWWKYEVVFNEAISVNNCWPDKELILSAKQVRELSSKKIMCSDSHYVL